MQQDHGPSVDFLRGLQLLGEIEASKGELYEWLSAEIADSEEVHEVLRRLSLDQVSHCSLIQLQYRIALKSHDTFDGVRVPLNPLDELRGLVGSFRRSTPRPEWREAFDLATEIEGKTVFLFDRVFRPALCRHLCQFMSSLRIGAEKHLVTLSALCNGTAAQSPVLAPANEDELIQLSVQPPSRTGLQEVEAIAEEEVMTMLNQVGPGAVLPLLDALPDGVYITDRNRRIIYWNRAAESIAGFPATEIVGSCCEGDGLNHLGEDGGRCCKARCPLKTAMERDMILHEQVFLHHRDGHRLPVSVTAHPLRDRDGVITGAIEVFRSRGVAGYDDLEELQRMAFLDPGTGIANRRFLETRIVSRLDELQRYGWTLGVIFFDLDDLKGINDSRGHRAGDQLLRMVSTTLAANLRSSDMVGRWGGDEFVAVIRNVDEQRLADLADKLCMLVRESAGWAGKASLRRTVSVGATLALPQDTLETLIDRCDRLMYRSKHQGGDRVTTDAPEPAATRPQRLPS